MKRTNILFFIAAAALCMSLCGMLFYKPASTVGSAVYTDSTAANTDFSIDTARQSIELCSYSYSSDKLEEALTERGCEEFRYFEKKQDTSYAHGIAFGIAKSKADSIDYVYLVIRGTNEKEWYSNFQIGEGTEHAGFSAAADYVIKSADSYLQEQKIDKNNTVIFLTGHSRGAAAANICSKRMLQSGEYRSVSAYTFACPNTTTADNTAYSGIYNIQNPEDFICSIPLSSWGYKRYGTDLYLPKKGDKNYYDLYTQMEDMYLQLTQNNHTGYPDGDRDVARFITALQKISPTIQDYYNKEITLFPHNVTMHEYMQSVAAFLCSDQSLTHGMILLSSGASSAFSSLTEFIMLGISADSLEDIDLTGGAIGCAHTYGTYEAWLAVLNDEYFSDNI